MRLLSNVLEHQPLHSNEATGLLKVITDYTYALDVLDQYDHQVLEIERTTKEELFQITYPEAMNTIQGLRDKFGGRKPGYQNILKKSALTYQKLFIFF